MSTGGDALLLIDLQEAFFEDETLARERGALVATVSELARAALDAGRPVLLITTEHSRDRSTWTLSMLEDGQGYLFPGDPGTAVIEELDTRGMTRIEKTRDSAFLGTDLLLRLRNLDVDGIVVAGVSTHACIAQTARDAYAHNIRASIVEDAVADHRPEHHRATLDLLVEDRQGTLVRSTTALRRWRA